MMNEINQKIVDNDYVNVSAISDIPRSISFHEGTHKAISHTSDSSLKASRSLSKHTIYGPALIKKGLPLLCLRLRRFYLLDTASYFPQNPRQPRIKI